MGRATGEQPILAGQPDAQALARRKDDRPLFDAIGRFLDEHRLEYSPSNYLLAYNLVTRANLAAVAAIEEATSDGVRLSQRDADRILAEAGVAMRGGMAASSPTDDLLEQARLHLETVEAIIGASHEHAARFGRDLETSAAELRTARAPTLEELLRLTAGMIERTRSAERELDEATQEVQSLRRELASVSEAARTDALTGLANRRALEDRFDWLQRSGMAFSASLCDIDLFKLINDSHGHGVGDRVLKAVASVLDANSAGHLVGRFGGEEFVVLLGGVQAPAAAALMDKARCELAHRSFRVRGTEAPIGQITFSAGVVEGRPGQGWDELIARADVMLYQAKSLGRNRVELEAAPEPAP
jgi:diguanylate cyclase